ncbi:MAG: ribosome-associated translation inhibitor RaiA [Bacteroidota bacterium]
MDINYEYNGVKASERLEVFTGKRMQKLVDRNDEIVAIDVYFKAEKTSEENAGKINGIRLNVPGTTLFAETSAGSFENAISETVDELQRQLRKYKAKLRRR